MLDAIIFRTLLALVLCVLIEPISAQQQAAQKSNSGHPSIEDHRLGKTDVVPPPEAFKACEGKSAGSRSEFTDPKGEILKGVCENDEQGKIVLRPDRMDDGKSAGHRGPPPEAYAACVGKAVKSGAQFVSPRGETIAGVCEMEGDRLVLRPDNPPSRDGEEKPVAIH